jgi:hypothetical protein
MARHGAAAKVTQGILKFACKALISRSAFAHHFAKKSGRINAARRTHAPQQLSGHLISRHLRHPTMCL